MKEYKAYILFATTVVCMSVLFYVLGHIILPFVVGLLLAYAANPMIKRIQKWIPNRNLAVTSFLTSTALLLVAFFWFIGHQAVNDFKRFNHAFVLLADSHKVEIDETKDLIGEYIKKIYPSDTSASLDLSSLHGKDLGSTLGSLDFEAIGESSTKLTSFFKSGTDAEEEKAAGINLFGVFVFGLGYFLVIVYSYSYFETRFNIYFNGEKESKLLFRQIIRDFKRTFVDYFRRRGIVVLISTVIFIGSFLLIGIPGAILMGLLAGLLCYVSEFHYFALIPLTLCCWAQSVESNKSFFLIFGLVFGVMVLVSVLEEFIFYPKIMKDVSGMNPAILMLSLTLWTYLLGTLGLLIALPLTSLTLLYLDRFLVYRKEKIESMWE